MKLNLVLLIVGIHFITLTRQESALVSLTVLKKCNPQQLEMRQKLTEYYDQLCGITTTTTTTTTSTTTTTTSTTTTTTTTTTPCGVPASALLPLLQLYNPTSKDHFYTNSTAEATKARTMFGYTVALPSPGKITISPSACTCAGVSLIPVYRLNTNTDHFYTTSFAEATSATGYTFQGIEWYCSPTPGLCGATLPLYRFYNSANTDHIYDTDISKGIGSTYEGILCYIWPT